MACVRFIAKRKKWVFDFRDLLGKRIIESFANEIDARHRLKMYEAAELLGIDPKPVSRPSPVLVRDRITIADAIRKYVAAVTEIERKPNTCKIEKKIFEYLYDDLHRQGIGRIDEISEQHIDSFRARLIPKFAPATVNRMFQVYKPFFKKLLRWKMINENPTAYVKGLRAFPKKKIPWTEEILKAVQSEVAEWARGPLQFMYVTGARPIQVANFRWKDFNANVGTWETTSEKGGVMKKLTLPLSSRDRDWLIELRLMAKRQFRGRDDKPVFLAPDGVNAFATSFLYTTVRRARKRLGLDGIAPYGNRHAFGTRLVANGVPLKVVAELMGHSDTRTTEGYVGDLSKVAREAIERDAEDRKDEFSA